MDGETAVPLVFSTDFDINKLWKNGNGVQVVFIDSAQVNKLQSMFYCCFLKVNCCIRLALFLKMVQL